MDSIPRSPELTADAIAWTLAPLPTEPWDDDPLVAALLEAEAYRCLVRETLHALHARTVDNDHLQQRHARLIDDYRRLRETGATP